MFKSFGKWFDSLWEGNPNHQEYKPATAELVENAQANKIEQMKERVCTKENVEQIVREAMEDAQMAILTRWYDYKEGKFNSEKKDFEYLWSRKSSRFLLAKQNDIVVYYNIESVFSETLRNVQRMDKDWCVKLFADGGKIQVVPYDVTREEVKAEQSRFDRTLNKAKPHTAAIYGEDVYLHKYNGRGVFLQEDHGHLPTPEMNILTAIIKEQPFRKDSHADIRPLIITNEWKVDHKLLPHQHWRRWVKITELEDANSKWVLRYVPRDIARGELRYFDIQIDFDAIDLGGVSFDLPKMLDCAISYVINNNDYELKGKRPVDDYEFSPHSGRAHRVKGLESDTFLNLNNLRIKHKELDLTPAAYVKQQNKHVAFHEANPYLNPNVNEVNVVGNIIGFDGGNEFYHYHINQCEGDKRPHGRHTNRKENI